MRCKFREKKGYVFWGSFWCNKLDEVCDVSENELPLCVSFEEKEGEQMNAEQATECIYELQGMVESLRKRINVFEERLESIEKIIRPDGEFCGGNRGKCGEDYNLTAGMNEPKVICKEVRKP